jgi:hypothetical protein
MSNAINVDSVRAVYKYEAEDELLRNTVTGRTIDLRTKQKYGYARLKINGISYQLSRIVWAVCKGEDPGTMVIDHIDRDKQNNTIGNLRCVTQADNNRNRLCTYEAPARCLLATKAEPTVSVMSEDDLIMQEYLTLISI